MIGLDSDERLTQKGVPRGAMSGGPSTTVRWRHALAALCASWGVAPRTDEPLGRHCTWRIGGPADVLIEPTAWSQVGALLRFADENGVPALVIGKGSNLLFDDSGVRGVVIVIGRPLAGFEIDDASVQVEAGISASRLARVTALAGLSGLEHIVGIPGTLGGLVVMNGGSLRQAIGDTIVQVRTIGRQGTPRVFHGDECDFAYRQSRFQREDAIVTAVTLKLADGDRTRILSQMRDILRERRQKFPMTLPSCGSVFKGDAELVQKFGPPGAVIERLGFKGTRIGDAVVSPQHANFIVNVGAARAADVLDLVRLIRQRVLETLGHTLTCEAKHVTPTAHVRPLEDAL